MIEEYKDFVGIYDESIPVELCNEFVNNYEEVMLSFYLLLFFIQWVSDVVDEKRWQVWKEWIL